MNHRTALFFSIVFCLAGIPKKASAQDSLANVAGTETPPKISFAPAANGWMPKIQVFQSAIARNPAFALEKKITRQFSVEAEYMRWNYKWMALSGGEWDFGKPQRLNGFGAGIKAKYYLPFKKKEALYAWYVSAIYRYNSFTVNDVEKSNRIGYSRTIDLLIQGPEAGILIGRQFSIFENFSTDIYLGLGRTRRTLTEFLVSGNAQDLKAPRLSRQTKLYLGWNIGYRLDFKKKGGS